MSTKKWKKLNKRIYLLAISWIFTASLCICQTACVKTPEQSAVVNKGDNHLQELISQPAVAEQSLDIPLRWDEDYTKGSVTIRMAADVDVPDVTNFPVLQISPMPFTMERIQSLCQRLAPNQTLYQWHDKTKSEAESILVRGKALLLEDNNAVTHPYGPSSDTFIEYYEGLLPQLPDSYPQDPVAMEFVPSTMGPVFSGMTEPDSDGRVLSVSCGNIEGNWGNYLLIDHHNPIEGYTECEQPYTPDIDMPFSLEQAESTAEHWMQSIGLDSFSLRSIGIGIKVDSALMQVFPMLMFQNDVYKQLDNCYVLYYTPVYNGIPCNYARTSAIDEDLPDMYNYLWGEEFINIYISEDGIESIQWQNGIGRIDNVLNENVQLLPYEQIQQILVKGLFNNFATDINRTDTITTVEIDQVKLSYRKVLIKDQKDANMLIPAWDLYGRVVYEFPNGYSGHDLALDENGRYVNNLYLHSLLTVSALDGSVINSVLGY